MRIALYCRVSTLLQFEKGNSIDEQKKRLQAYCESRGWENFEFFVDAGYSGSNMERPALQDLIQRITEFDTVLVYNSAINPICVSSSSSSQSKTRTFQEYNKAS